MIIKLKRIFIYCLSLSFFFFIHCSGTKEKKSKLLIFGIDAASWKVLDKLVAQNYLPTFQYLIQNGTKASVKTLYPTVSVMLWTTIATGMLPEHHGISNWLREGSNTSGQLAITSDIRRAPAFWNIWYHKMIVSNWWATWPAEKINGIMISNRTHFSNLEDTVYPSSFKRCISSIKFKSKEELESILSDFNPYHSHIQLTDFMVKQLQRDRFYLDAAHQVFSNDHSDVLALFVRGIDVLEHEYLEDVMPYPGSPDLSEKQKGIVIAYYRYLDSQVHRFMELMGTDELRTVIISDHGMEPIIERPPFIEGLNINKLFHKIAELTDNKNKNFYLNFHDNMLYPPGLKRGLSWHGKQFSSEQLQEFINDLSSIQINKSTLFSNVKVNPGKEKELITLEIDPTPGINDSIYYKNNKFPLLSVSDIILHPRSGQHWNSPDGIFLACGPGIKLNKDIGEIRIQDIMPTISVLNNEAIAQNLDGEPILDIFTSEFLMRNKPVFRKHYTWTPPVPSKSSKLVEKTIRNELKSLGYIH